MGAMQLDARRGRCARRAARRRRIRALICVDAGGVELRPAASRSASCAIADGATGVHPPCASGMSCPPSQGTCDEPLRPACASWIATGTRAAHSSRDRQALGQRFFARVVVEAEAAVGDAADGGHRGGFDGEHARVRLQKLAPVDDMPVGGAAVYRRVLAHGRDDDAIGERELAKREGREKSRWHGDGEGATMGNGSPIIAQAVARRLEAASLRVARRASPVLPCRATRFRERATRRCRRSRALAGLRPESCP